MITLAHLVNTFDVIVLSEATLEGDPRFVGDNVEVFAEFSGHLLSAADQLTCNFSV